MNTDAILTSQKPPSGAARPFVVDWRRSFRDGRLPASTMAVGYTLAEYANGDGTRAYPGEKNLSRCVSLSERVVRRHLKALLTAGWVTQELPGFPGHHAVYRLAIPSGTRPAPQQDRPAVGTGMSAVTPEQRTVVTDEPGTATSGYQEPVQSPKTPYQDHGLDGVALREKPSSLRSSKSTADAKPVTSPQPPAQAFKQVLGIASHTSIGRIKQAYPNHKTDPQHWALLNASMVHLSCRQRFYHCKPFDVPILARELDRLAEEHSHTVIEGALVEWMKPETAERSRAGWDAEKDFSNTIEHHIALTTKSMKEEAAEMPEELATIEHDIDLTHNEAKAWAIDMAEILARDFPEWWPEQNLPRANTHVLAATIAPLVEQHGPELVDTGLDLWLEDKGGQPCKNPFGLMCSQIASYVDIAKAGRKPNIIEEIEEDEGSNDQNLWVALGLVTDVKERTFPRMI